MAKLFSNLLRRKLPCALQNYVKNNMSLQQFQGLEMSQKNENLAEAKVAKTIPLAREVLKGSQQLVRELVGKDSSCTIDEYMAYFLNASIVLTALVAQVRIKGDGNV